jgi:L-seryl-tRNA(Ser) seleniumtransferase
MGLRDLPSVDALSERLRSDFDLPAPLVRAMVRDAVDRARDTLRAGGDADAEALGRRSLEGLASRRPRRVINATGVLLHTNLGRAPLATKALDLAAPAATGYGNVEFDLRAGERGGRGAYVGSLLSAVTGAEAALAVNNNAAALVLALAALAGDGGVVVSRGELIEIGGSFRLPDLMAASGARLIEVGTTNRTRIGDYTLAMSDAALVLKVHPSNYRIEGFAAEVDYRALGRLAAEHRVPFVADVGSGLLDTRTPWLEGAPPAWLSGEPGVRQTLESGADVVLFSGDKLLGGPQAGIAVGRAPLIEAMRSHPLARAFRMSGLVESLLAATVEHYASGEAAALPFWRMATLRHDELAARHHRVVAACGIGEVVDDASLPGAGSVPGETIPSPAIRLAGRGDAAWKALVAGRPPIVGRRREGALSLDLRTVDPTDDDLIAAALARLG